MKHHDCQLSLTAAVTVKVVDLLELCIDVGTRKNVITFVDIRCISEIAESVLQNYLGIVADVAFPGHVRLFSRLETCKSLIFGGPGVTECFKGSQPLSWTL